MLTFTRYMSKYFHSTIIFVWLVIVLLFYIPNNGGHGLSLPINIISWGVCGFLMFCCAINKNRIVIFHGSILDWPLLLFAGAFIWSLPILWSPDTTAFREGLPHVLALWGYLLLLYHLRKLPCRPQRLVQWVNIIWIAALAQGIFGFIQCTLLASNGLFRGERPFGIFQQVNLFASFLATGLSCLFYSYIRQRNTSSMYQIISSFSLFFFPFMLILLQSRTGGIGAVLALIILTLTFLRHGPYFRYLFLAWGLMLIGVSVALLWQYGAITIFVSQFSSLVLQAHFNIRDTSSSTYERLHILFNTLHIIRHHPIIGSGYGTFEAVFARTAIEYGRGIVGQTLIHPHNELLYAWAEGGMFGLGGLLLIVIALIIGINKRGGLGWYGISLLMPIAVHINLEYPLYQSVPHGIVLTMLISLSLPGQPITTPIQFRRGNLSSFIARITVLISSGILMIFMFGAFKTQMVLTRIERMGMSPMLDDLNKPLYNLWNIYPYTSRIEYDQHIALLMRYNQQPDSYLLRNFFFWGEGYLTYHNDRYVMNDMICIANLIFPQKVPELCLYAHKLWPFYNGFDCNFYNSFYKK